MKPAWRRLASKACTLAAAAGLVRCGLVAGLTVFACSPASAEELPVGPINFDLMPSAGAAEPLRDPAETTQPGSSATIGPTAQIWPGETGAAAVKIVRELERGGASWYGPGFQGRRTASGERYDMRGLTAAHRSLPFGTLVRVRSLVNGREVEVRINDRGPFSRARVIDVSHAAALELGMLEMGIKTVQLLTVGEAYGPEQELP